MFRTQVSGIFLVLTYVYAGDCTTRVNAEIDSTVAIVFNGLG
jgi:hypothetical protein